MKTDNARYLQPLSAFGFREVGTAPNLYQHASKWYTDIYQDETVQGIVLQLPARNGKVQLFAATRATTDDDNGAVVYMRAVDTIDTRESEPDSSDYRDAAIYADELASDRAERERDYNRAWQAGLLYAQNREEMRIVCRDLRKYRAELRTLPAAHAVAVKALQSMIESNRRELSRLVHENETLKSGDYQIDNDYLGFYPDDKELAGAFNDGAGSTIL